MSLRTKSTGNLAFVALVVIACCTSSLLTAEERLLSRTLYVPMSFAICPEIDSTSVRLWIAGDEENKFTPLPRVFMFTYYPKQRRFLPSHIELQVEADVECEHEDLNTSIYITPEGVFTDVDSASFDDDQLRKQIRQRHRDLRTQDVIVRLSCENTCGHSRSESAQTPLSGGQAAPQK